MSSSDQKQFEQFLNLFENIEASTFAIFPRAFAENDSDYLFRGRLIDSANLLFMIGADHVESYNFEDVYACSKFEYKPKKYLLIFRAPGEFYSSPLRIATWDQKLGVLTSIIENVGRDENSAGYGMYSESILQLDALQLTKTIYETRPDRDVYENENVIYSVDTLIEYYRIENYHWKKID